MEREEAIEVIKKNWPDSSFTMLREALETLILELKESEDEKIKEELKAHVGLLCDGLFPQKKDWLAWLEKQGKQKSYASETMNEKGDFDSGFTRMMEKEQKPAWSEEDEERLQSCLNILQAKGLMEATDTINTKWLKSLKDRVQPKPSWSEEDRRMLTGLIDELDAIMNKATPNEISVYSKYTNWLHSLRPQKQWKPSEEQMKALNTCIMQGEISYVGQGTELQSLYNDLKKFTE